jgi:hypothetical protein
VHLEQLVEDIDCSSLADIAYYVPDPAPSFHAGLLELLVRMCFLLNFVLVDFLVLRYIGDLEKGLVAERVFHEFRHLLGLADQFVHVLLVTVVALLD